MRDDSPGDAADILPPWRREAMAKDRDLFMETLGRMRLLRGSGESDEGRPGGPGGDP